MAMAAATRPATTGHELAASVADATVATAVGVGRDAGAAGAERAPNTVGTVLVAPGAGVVVATAGRVTAAVRSAAPPWTRTVSGPAPGSATERRNRPRSRPTASSTRATGSDPAVTGTPSRWASCAANGDTAWPTGMMRVVAPGTPGRSAG